MYIKPKRYLWFILVNIKFKMFQVYTLHVFILFIYFVNAEFKYKTDFKLIKPHEVLEKRRNQNGTNFDSKFAAEKTSRDNGGNYGDLLYKYRQNGDVLLLREVVIAEVLYSNDQDIRW